MTNCKNCRHPECLHEGAKCMVTFPQKPYGYEPDIQCTCPGFEEMK